MSRRKQQVEDLVRDVVGLKEKQRTFEDEVRADIATRINNAIQTLNVVATHEEARWFYPPRMDLVYAGLQRTFREKGLGRAEDCAIRPLLPSDLGLKIWATQVWLEDAELEDAELIWVDTKVSPEQVIGIVGTWVPAKEEFSSTHIHFYIRGSRLWIQSIEELKALHSDIARVKWFALDPSGGMFLPDPGDSLMIRKVGTRAPENIGLIGFVAERWGRTIARF